MLKHVPKDRLRVLLDNYRTASRHASATRARYERIDLDGRYHLDGTPPPMHDRHHDEHHAAVMLAESLMRWVDDGGR